jgi:hypothetical protein
MSYPHRPAGPAPVLRAKAELTRPWTVTPNGRPARAMPLTRRYETLWLNPEGEVVEATRVGPAMPAFEGAFSAFARGALIAVPGGAVAIEDLLPGMVVDTRTGPAPVRWLGRITLPPANLRQDGGPEIFRINGDAFGADRPQPDVVLCSGARIAHRAARLAASMVGPEVLVPIADFADGINVTAIAPMSAVQSFHLMLDRHEVIGVNGIPVESYHPGTEVTEALQGDMLRLFTSFFPWTGGIEGFGPPALPRLGLEQIDAISAA